MKERSPQRSKGYVDTLTCSMVKHVLPILGDLPVDEIEATQISMVLNKYLQTFSASGANSIGRHIGALLGFAVENKWIKGHERPKDPRIPVQKKPRPIITIEDLDKFLEAIDAQGALDISFLARAQVLMGMRVHEARLMKWSGLSLERKIFTPEKTKNGDAPVMPIPEAMIPWFKKMAEISGGTFGFICPGLVEGKPRTHDYTSPYIKRALKQAGLSDRITNHRLRKSRFTEEQIILALKQHEVGLTAVEICRKLGVSEQTFYRWKVKFGGMDVADAKRLKGLEEENRKLKQLVGELSLNNQGLSYLLTQKF